MDSQESSPRPQFQSINPSAFFAVQISHPYMTKGTYVGKVMSLLFNMLSRFTIAFLLRSKRLLTWMQSLSTVILEPKKIVCHCFHFFPIYLPWSDGNRYHDLSLKSAFSFSISPSSRGFISTNLSTSAKYDYSFSTFRFLLPAILQMLLFSRIIFQLLLVLIILLVFMLLASQ